MPLSLENHLNYNFPKEMKICSKLEISHIFNTGIRVRDHRIMLLGVKSQDANSRRFAVTISKKHGNAVIRNRIKRLCREALRLTQHDLPTGIDIVLFPRVGITHDVTAIQKSLKSLGKKLAKRIFKANDHNSNPSAE